jgi:hypothetical protein
MNVRELIEILSKYDLNQRVIIAGYEGGYNDIETLKEVEVELNIYDEWFYGSHEEHGSYGSKKEQPDEKALCIL